MHTPYGHDGGETATQCNSAGTAPGTLVCAILKCVILVLVILDLRQSGMRHSGMRHSGTEPFGSPIGPMSQKCLTVIGLLMRRMSCVMTVHTGSTKVGPIRSSNRSNCRLGKINEK